MTHQDQNLNTTNIPLEHITPYTQQPSVNVGDFTKISDKTGKELRFRTQLSKKARLMLLKVLLCKGYTDKQLGVLLQCSERTVWTLKQEFFESEEYWLQIDEELYSLLHDDAISKQERLRTLAQLKKQRMMSATLSKAVGETKVEFTWKECDPLKEKESEQISTSTEIVEQK